MQEKIEALKSMIKDLQDAMRAIRSEYQPEQLSETAQAYFHLIDTEIHMLHGDVERLSQFLPAQQEPQS